MLVQTRRRLSRVDFNYVLANDFKVEIWSDRQTGLSRRTAPAAIDCRGD